MAITFDSIAGGQLSEQFKMALAQIGRNILDPNMDPAEARSMTVSLTFKPMGSGAIDIKFTVKTKLAGLQKSGTMFLVGQDARTGRIEMTEYGSREPMPVVPAVPPSAAYTDVRSQPEPEQPFDPATGEILDTAPKKPIDLRAAQ